MLLERPIPIAYVARKVRGDVLSVVIIEHHLLQLLGEREVPEPLQPSGFFLM